MCMDLLLCGHDNIKKKTIKIRVTFGAKYFVFSNPYFIILFFYLFIVSFV